MTSACGPVVERRDEARRADAVRERVGVVRPAVRERPLLERAEQRRRVERGAPGAAAVRGRVAAVRRDDPLDRGVDGVLERAPVPDERERAVRPQDPVDLRQRCRTVEPVERLGDGDGVGARVRERDRLGRPVERAGRGVADPCPHLGDGLDRHDLGAGRGERAGELARPGREVDDGRAPAGGRAARRARPRRRAGSRGARGRRRRPSARSREPRRRGRRRIRRARAARRRARARAAASRSRSSASALARRTRPPPRPRGRPRPGTARPPAATPPPRLRHRPRQRLVLAGVRHGRFLERGLRLRRQVERQQLRQPREVGPQDLDVRRRVQRRRGMEDRVEPHRPAPDRRAPRRGRAAA